MSQSLKSTTGSGVILWRGDSKYEDARRAAAWNQLLPARYPEVIVLAKSPKDVREAITLAKQNNLRIGIRSGGHSWSANHVRDGGLLLDLSGMQQVAIDKSAMRATVEPGCKGDRLLTLLSRERLFFPVGHCLGVGLGGFLLQGGYGWHSRALGPACMSVEGVDVVTADGDSVYASSDQNSDLYWAARGAGPGFFGVVTKFHLRLYPMPKIVGAAIQHYPVKYLDEVFTWAHSVGPSIDSSVELMLVMSRHVFGVQGPGIIVIAPVIADSLDDVRQASRFMLESPLRKYASFKLPFLPTGFRMLLHGVKQHYPDGYNYSVDNMWTKAPIESLLPGLRKIADSLPPAPSHMLWMNWMPSGPRPEMAYSIEDNIYIALYSAWKDNRHYQQCYDWPVDRIKEMQHLSTGIQLADENLARRPGKFITDENMSRFRDLRAQYDPDRRFFSWMNSE